MGGDGKGSWLEGVESCMANVLRYRHSSSCMT